MTLNQLRYVVETAEAHSITEAAARLFITQPSLTSAIHALEEELGIRIFTRTNKGIRVTADGEEFLAYARQMLWQERLMHQRYGKRQDGKPRFSVSAQHYSFAIEAFVDLLREVGETRYEFHMRETETYRILEDVGTLRSEVGVLYRSPYNATVIMRAIAAHGLRFTPLFRARPHVFISKRNPLAAKEEVTLADLRDFPRLSYEQGDHNAFYFAEELQSTLPADKELIVTDRATLFNLLIGLGGYTISSGVINAELNGADIIARPLRVTDYMEVGVVQHGRVRASNYARRYIACLKRRLPSEAEDAADSI
ncbi:LysR family transcriptional regulator [Mitsuokella sp. oral taxon 131]|uniref:LysR family transcriptional regulator n=1 Tax=Mitsuokella sp. oral taxon 131 TaxID=1321780 RepID=UPI0003F4CE36|nr:LysR family transcriptional regulator [Mitsuokella sp. oral taxon 131]